MTSLPSAAERPRRILISGGLVAGGAQTHVTLLCALLREAGAEVTVAAAATNWTPEAVAGLRASGVRVVVSPFGFGRWRALGKLWSAAAWPLRLRRDYDALCCIGEGKMHFFAAKFVPRGFRIYHEIVECPAAGSVAAQVAETMDGLVANSTRVGAAMERLLPAVPVRTLPFLTASAPMPAPQPRPAVGRRTLRIAFLGRLAPHKRPHRLIEALPAWDRTAPVGPARLDLYGGDYDGQGARLRELIDQFGLGDRVALRGGYTTADLPRIFAQSDLVVLPSTYEGLPLVLVEAMQHGVPIVATSAGGTAELGEGNPDAVVTPGTGWEEFEEGVVTMARRLRAGKIDAVRLHGWTEARYGFAAVSTAWLEALLAPQRCFAAAEPEEVLP